jgi:hypothetical protein
MWSLAAAFAFAADAVAPPPPKPPPPIAADREWEELKAPTDSSSAQLRAAFREAGAKLGDWKIEVAGTEIDGPLLVKLADSLPDDPFVRVVREAMVRPIDPTDLLYFLDDVLVAGKAGRRGEPFYLPMGRARSAGILVHPDDIFEDDDPRDYPDKPTIAIDEPPPQESFPPAKDGEVLGPNWTMRFKSPEEPAEMYRTLAEKRPDASFPSRIAALVFQLQAQGAEVYLTSFLRYRERGYLMWGAHLLRSCTTYSCVSKGLVKLKAANASWAHVPIVWSHPSGWRATKEAARQMADAYDVVFATERGARYSNHYDGTAADFVVMGLPRTVELYAPSGEHKTFDLSGPEQTRDLSLTPELIDWIEANFDLHKLESDHPHWDDATAM